MAEFWKRLAICIFATGFYFAAGARMFGVMQQCGYKNARFYAWLKRRDNLWYNRLCLFFLILLLSCTLTAVCFSFLGAAWARLLSLIPFACFAAAFCVAEGKAPLKVPLARTGRIKAGRGVRSASRRGDLSSDRRLRSSGTSGYRSAVYGVFRCSFMLRAAAAAVYFCSFKRGFVRV